MTLFDQEPADDVPPAPVEQEAAAAVTESGSERLMADADPVEVGGGAVRVRMELAYDGSGFRGFAPNLGVRTVAGELAGAIGKVLGREEVSLVCAGRTDAGVHAWGQVVHFDTPLAPDLVAFQRSLNKMLGPSVVIRSAGVADPGFHARHSATGRRYRYTVLNRPLPDPFLATTTWHVDEPLDLRSMNLACDPLLGEHDWSSFCKRPPGPDPASGPRSLVRTVREAGWTDLGAGLLRFEVEASAFCHQMVRSLVGVLVLVGRGRARAGDIGGVIRAKDRSQAGEPAPPHGLCLWEVTYRQGAQVL